MTMHFIERILIKQLIGLFFISPSKKALTVIIKIKIIKIIKYDRFKHRVPQCMSLRRNWDPPTPSPGSECGGGGAAHSPAGQGVEEPQFQ